MLNNQNKRNYTFLLTKKSKSNIYIKRVEVSKKFLQTSVFTLILSLGISSIGFVGLTRNFELAETDTSNPLQARLASQTIPADYQSFNYERPDATLNVANNAGGPWTDFQLTNESESEEAAMEDQLRMIQATSSPEFIPNIWSHLGKINNEFGFRRNPFGGRTYEFHAGMDIDGERGDRIIAPASGTIVKAGWQGGYGNMIEIDHGNGLTTRYGHLSRVEVQVGDPVKRGQPIGLIGSTGRSTGPHLHYELRLFEKAINPRRFLPPEPTEIGG
jgi:murein DD-endopeptidase MepM/ murein hydrolase activator NlpD